jgi:ABC-type bacteriocin/lantibiotic exporter with double-glycine peptidase domain
MNVALGLSSELVDDSAVWNALERASLSEFLKHERDGLETLIGEHGVQLSGGQRQRLGIARALYSKPSLLILDEATSSLDAETERVFVETLAKLKGEVTTITIAHRLATVKDCEHIIFLNEGTIQAQGTFDEVRNQIPNFDQMAQLLGL